MTMSSRLAAEIARRRLVIPFEHGTGVNGLLIGDWRPRKLFTGQTPTAIRKGALYCVRDGEPFALNLPTVRCSDPESLDVPLLFERAMARRKPASKPVAGNPALEAESLRDPFLDLAWGRDFLFARYHPVVTESSMAIESHRGATDDILGQAAQKVTQALREAGGHFVGRLGHRPSEVAAFMRSSLPHFTWGAFHALNGNTGEGAWDFARMHPLLAGRSLACADVARAADAGEMRRARELSLRPGLVGAWTCDALAVHPGLASACDGSRWGATVDRAVRFAAGLDRNHVPRDVDAFSSYVDVCAWVEAVMGSPDPAQAQALLSRLKGRWAEALSACRMAAVLGSRELAPAEVSWALMDMNFHFGKDLIEPAIRVRSGDVRLTEVYGSPDGGRRYSGATNRMALKGMGLADRIRHAARYKAAKPAIAAVGRDLPGCPEAGRWGVGRWKSGNLIEGGMPWLGVDDTLEVKPSYLGSIATAAEWTKTVGPRERRHLDHVYLPASTPDGSVLAICLRRGSAGPSMRGRMTLSGPDETRSRLAPALTAYYGCADVKDLGDAMLEQHGVSLSVAEAGRELVEASGTGLVTVRDAWGEALPRRFRRLGETTLVKALTTEFDEEMAGTPARPSRAERRPEPPAHT